MKKRLSKNRKLWWAPLAIAFVVMSAIFLPKLPRFPMTVKQLHVQGVRALSAVDINSMIGSSFASVTKAITAQLKTNPRVENVTVLRDMTGQVVVQVNERKPAALVNLDRLYYIDAEGTLLEPAQPNSLETKNLVVITGPWNQASATSAGTLRPTFLSGLELMAALIGGAIEQKQISEIHFDPLVGWILYRVGSDVPIWIGQNHFELKADRLKRVWADIQAKSLKVEKIDLDYRDRVIVKIKPVT